MQFRATHVLIAIVWGLLLMPGQSLGQSSTSASASDEGRPLAFVHQFKPQVSIFNRASQKYTEADQGKKLYDGDTLATGENGYAAVRFMDRSLAKVKPSSILIVNGSVDDDTRSMSTRLLLNAGEVLMNVNDAGRSDFEVATSSSVATVKGTEFASSVSSTGATTHYVFEGTVNVLATESGQTEEVGAGMFAQVDQEGETITTGQMDESEQQRRREEFEQAEEKMQPKTLKIRLRDENGNTREVELKYYENDGEQNDGEQ